MADTKPGFARLSDLAFIPENFDESRDEVMARKIYKLEGRVEGLREYITWLEEKNAELQKQNEVLLLLTKGRVN